MVADALELVACVGCGGAVPDVEGPTHAYMLASPGCWELYGRWAAERAWSAQTAAVIAAHHVDCYAVQHPGGAESDRRQRQSIAVHLISLCRLLEFDQPVQEASRSRARTSQTVLTALSLADWPLLDPPESLGTTTIADLARVAGDGRAAGVARARRARHRDRPHGRGREGRGGSGRPSAAGPGVGRGGLDGVTGPPRHHPALERRGARSRRWPGAPRVMTGAPPSTLAEYHGGSYRTSDGIVGPHAEARYRSRHHSDHRARAVCRTFSGEGLSASTLARELKAGERDLPRGSEPDLPRTRVVSMGSRGAWQPPRSHPGGPRARRRGRPRQQRSRDAACR